MPGSVTFLTLFLSLLTGAHPVTVAVTGEVTRVELRLDGESLGFMDSEPWTMICEFGEDLEPHELVAVGYDRRGGEIARAAQRINLPRAQAEARLTLAAPDHGPPRTARLTWSTVENLRPQSIAVLFDDRPLDVEDPEVIPLPAYDPRRPHFLSAELTFAGGLEARTLTSFGGELGGVVSTELTALPIVAADPKTVAPPAQAMSGWFYSRGSPARVFAVEKTPAEVLMVVDYQALDQLRKIEGLRARPETVRRRIARRPPFPRRRWHPADGLPRGLRKDDRFRFVATFPRLLAGNGSQRDKLIFEIGPDLNDGRDRIAIAPTLLRAAAPPATRPQSLAEAVAVAAKTAAAGERARAVVLVVTESPEDVSGLSPANVRGYAGKLRVPLHVWRTFASDSATAWGGCGITTVTELKAALKRLRDELDRQWVVWLEGRHLPQDVELRHHPWKIAGSP